MSNDTAISHSKHVVSVAGQAQVRENDYRATNSIVDGNQASAPMQESQFKSAVARLNKTLSSGVQLRSDVPRGFYLNIRI